MLKKIIIALALALLVFFLSKDYLAKTALKQILSKKFHLESEIGACKVNFSGISLTEVKVYSESFILEIPRLKVQFKGLKIKKIIPPEFTLKLGLKNIDVFLTGKDIDFAGSFLGEFILEFGPKGSETIEGNLISIGPGEINIKKDTALSGLKNYMDEPSYAALLSSFKNYSYNWGRISIAKSHGAATLGLNFDSARSGKRNITLNLHQD